MGTNLRKIRSYDLDIKRQIIQARNPRLFPALNIPRNTALNWIRKGVNDVTVLPSHSESICRLKVKVLELEKTIERMRAMASFRDQVLSDSGCVPNWKGIRMLSTKLKILDSIGVQSTSLSLSDRLDAIGLSRKTYNLWLASRRVCHRIPEQRCLKRYPQSLTVDEIQTMKKLVTGPKYSHFSIRALSLFAQREKLLCCSRHTWYRYINQFQWKRCRIVHPSKCKTIGIRATAPNEIWHVDTSQYKLQTGVKSYIQAVIDNYSKRVLAWSVSATVSGINTAALIRQAAYNSLCQTNFVASAGGSLMMDAGTENLNRDVAVAVAELNLKKIVAKVDVRFSNARVESLFRSLKTNYLRQQRPRSLRDLGRQVGFYFSQYNGVIPHNSFDGATPDEAHWGSWTPARKGEMRAAVQKARKDRVLRNRQKPQCDVNCQTLEAVGNRMRVAH